MDELYEKTIPGYFNRMCSLEHFMKELKERFSRWFNKRHGRQGRRYWRRGMGASGRRLFFGIKSSLPEGAFSSGQLKSEVRMDCRS